MFTYKFTILTKDPFVSAQTHLQKTEILQLFVQLLILQLKFYHVFSRHIKIVNINTI